MRLIRPTPVIVVLALALVTPHTSAAGRTASGGLPQSRASDGPYLSYSEPHVSVDPLDANHLVAASKMYQHLDNYLFKVGTFVSFDGGRTWRENGHLPGYPRQTGRESPDDYYITSDPWTAFDDEGNAYVMVLDNPSEARTGAGWGMTLHKSTDGGRTWGGRIPIHSYDDPVTQALFLDDKNALAVDNYGRDGDGVTGPMYGCWSLDAIAANLAVVVARSADGGATWSAPLPVSGADQLVIGCQVAIAPPPVAGEPGIVHVFWLDVERSRIRMATSSDGATFGPPVDVAPVRQLPGRFPNSHFRNASLPTAGADPRTGALYVAWADYHRRIASEPCPNEGGPARQVCDGDILLVRSEDGGRTWSRPARVNRDRLSNGKDQFQPALAVTPRGQVALMWFDRRRDPENLVIDTWFARSNDGGRTWRETRVTRRPWDPRINPPRPGGVDFIGDYQGLAATDRGAVPFWNDTSLAGLPTSDPRHSPYQEAFSAWVPNTAPYGGPAR